jgi:hypothetical protein
MLHCMTILKPRPGAWLPLLIVCTPICGIGIAGLLEDISAWPWSLAAIALGLGVVGYNATVRLVLTGHEVQLRRYGWTVWRAPLRGTRLIEGRAGSPAWIPAYVLSRDGEEVGFVLKSWFGARAITQLREALAS